VVGTTRRILGRRIGCLAALVLMASSLSGCLGWFSQFSTLDHSELVGISCPDASTCFAIGDPTGMPGATILRRTTDSGGHWTDLSSTAPSSLTSIFCVDDNHCLVAGLGVYSTNDGGSTWNTLVTPEDSVWVQSLWCSDGMHCWATWNTSQVTLTQDGGATWSSTSVPASVDGAVNPVLMSITCPTSSECIGTGSQILWSTGLPIPVPQYIGLLSWSNDGGATWKSATGPGGPVSCLTPADCISTSGPTRLLTTDGGATWTASAIPVPGGLHFGQAISCPDAEHCISVGSDVLATDDGGATWNVQPTRPNDVNLFSVSCPSVTTCWAAGGTTNGSAYGSIVLHTITGGDAWPSISSIAPTQGPFSGGTQITILGQGFIGSPMVTFGSGPGAVAATNVTVVSSHQLSVTVPACPCVPTQQGLPVAVTVTEPVLGSSPANQNYLFTYTGS
jgi:photosystem II stability/assembly factor-like uncharacterized protein